MIRKHATTRPLAWATGFAPTTVAAGIAASLVACADQPVTPNASSAARRVSLSAATTEVCNTTGIAVPAGAPGATLGPAAPYPSTLAVSGVTGTVTKVTATLRGFTHQRPDDVDILLVGPGGQRVVLMSDAGGATPVSDRTLTFDDAVAGSLPDDAAIAAGSYRPSAYEAGDAFAAPAPAAPYATALAAFNGVDPNGTWSLYVVDDQTGEVGDLKAGAGGGWCLNVTTQTAQPPTAAAGTDRTVSCGSAVPLDGSGSTDADGTIVSYEWYEGTTLLARGAKPAVTLGVGTHTLRLVVTDNDGATDDDDVVITVQNAISPVLTLAVSPTGLRPPNHKYVPIRVTATATHACRSALTVTGSVVSSEPDEATGDGNTTGDIRVTRPDGTVLLSSRAAPAVPFDALTDRLELRAERAGGGDRIYTITVTATDASGNAATRTAAVTVGK